MSQRMEREKGMKDIISRADSMGHDMVLREDQRRQIEAGEVVEGLVCGEVWYCAHEDCKARIASLCSDGSDPTFGPKGTIERILETSQMGYECGVQSNAIAREDEQTMH